MTSAALQVRGLAALLLAVFPANVHAAREALTIGGAPATPLVARTVLQIVFLAAVIAAGFASSSGSPHSSRGRRHEYRRA
jgi:uncharacterized membrane protein